MSAGDCQSKANQDELEMLLRMETHTNMCQLESLTRENEDVALQPLSFRLHPSSVGIILEGNVVMDNIDRIPQAVCLLFGLTYALHLDYPNCMGNTFLFMQQVLLGLGKKELKGKILAVKNQLAM